jgi:hypothetical protein
MGKYQTLGPDAEVYGGAMLAFVESIRFENFKPILEKHGLQAIDPQKWYPQQLWLDVFNDIVQEDDSMSNMVSIGMKIAETAVEGLTGISFVDLMLGFGKNSYEANNRGADIGTIETRIIDDKHILMVDGTPYPDEFVYGAYYAMARRFLPAGSDFTVAYDTDEPTRNQGGAVTKVHIQWK